MNKPLNIIYDLPLARVVTNGLNPQSDDDIVVYRKVGRHWESYVSLNSFTNDAAFTQAREFADKINKGF